MNAELIERLRRAELDWRYELPDAYPGRAYLWPERHGGGGWAMGVRPWCGDRRRGR
jgi:hypothetical protein